MLVEFGGRWYSHLGSEGRSKHFPHLEMADQSRHIEVVNLWKVFSRRPRRVDRIHSAKGLAEIQEDLGLHIALRDVSFQVERGEVFVVMGLSGSGKSTLVRCLTRLIEPTRGEVRFDGKNIFNLTRDDLIQFRRRVVAMVFQHYALLPHRRVIDNVAYGLEIRGVGKQERYKAASEAIERVGLKGWDRSFPHEMSGGMQQRVGLARALAVDPEVLLMDEPFSGLDPLIRRQMQDQLLSLETEIRKTIVFITHDMNEALKIGDRIAIMRDGAIVQLGSPKEIVTQPADEYVAQFVKDVSKAKVIQAGTIMQNSNATVDESQGPQVALKVMEGNKISRVFLLDSNKVLKGVLTQDQAAMLASQGVATLEGIETEMPATASPDDYVEDTIPMVAQTTHPLAVVDENRRLLGQIHQRDLLASMVEGRAGDDSISNT